MSFNPSGHIRSTTETNFKGRIRAVNYGEDTRVINPGDMILEMEQVNQGDRLGGSVDRFEIYIAGRDMAGLLDQVTRAHELFKYNADWLLSPATRDASPQTIADHKPIEHAGCSIIRKRPKRSKLILENQLRDLFKSYP